MTKAKTAFELYLEENPSSDVSSRHKPVTFFDPNTRREDMADFRPVRVAASDPDPEGYQNFIPTDGSLTPKGWSAPVSAPTSPEQNEGDEGLNAIAGKEVPSVLSSPESQSPEQAAIPTTPTLTRPLTTPPSGRKSTAKS